MSRSSLKSRWKRAVPSALVASLAFAGVLAVPAQAAPASVSTEADLRKALAESLVETITVTKSITLTGGQLPINRAVNITGANGVVISGNDASRIFQIKGGTDVAPDYIDVQISNLTLTRGNGDPDGPGAGGVGDGGAIDVFYGDLTLDKVTVSDSTAPNGGGIKSAYGSSLTILNSTISGNEVTGVGGGIFNMGAGGGLLENSTIYGNKASLHGGGIYHDGGYRSTGNALDPAHADNKFFNIYFSTITANHVPNDVNKAGGGVYLKSGDLRAAGTIFVGNEAGSYLGANPANGDVTITELDAAILVEKNEPWAWDLQLSNNIFRDEAWLSHVSDPASTANIQGSTVADTFQSIERDYLNQPTDEAVLANNGGPTKTVKLADTGELNEAIDTFNASLYGAAANLGLDVLTLPTTDQTGFARPNGEQLDLGAWEWRATPLPSNSGTSPSALAPTPVRLGGDDRYGTSVSISQQLFPAGGVPVVYIATGATYPDALAASSAANAQGGPVLLVKKDTLPSTVAAELARLKPGRIVVMGGTAAISEGVATELAAYGNVERIAGADRYETALEISQEFTQTGKYVILVTGADYADAISSSSLFGSYAGPVLLVEQGYGLSPEVEAELNRLKPARVFIVGGTSAVTVEAESDAIGLGYDVTRLGAPNRYLTSVAVADWVRTNNGYGSTALATTGKTFPDGLTSGVMAGQTDAPTLLTNGSCFTPEAVQLLENLAPNTINLIGGKSALGDSVGEITVCS